MHEGKGGPWAMGKGKGKDWWGSNDWWGKGKGKGWDWWGSGEDWWGSADWWGSGEDWWGSDQGWTQSAWSEGKGKGKGSGDRDAAAPMISPAQAAVFGLTYIGQGQYVVSNWGAASSSASSTGPPEAVPPPAPHERAPQGGDADIGPPHRWPARGARLQPDDRTLEFRETGDPNTVDNRSPFATAHVQAGTHPSRQRPLLADYDHHRAAFGVYPHWVDPTPGVDCRVWFDILEIRGCDALAMQSLFLLSQHSAWGYAEANLIINRLVHNHPEPTSWDMFTIVEGPS